MTLASLAWSAPPTAICLEPDSVHLWRAWVRSEDAAPAGLREALPPEEQQRADDLRPGQPRQRFIASRGLLRLVLARYTGLAPTQLRFELGPHGKPALSSQSGGGAIRFNLSHSHDMLLCAVNLHRNVGVDLEYVRPLPAIDRMAARVLSANEAAAWQVLPDEQKLPVFFATWTRKEALVKGLGERLAAAFARVDVTLVPGQEAVCVPVQDGRTAWTIYSLPLAGGYAGAMAVEGIELALHWRSYHLVS
jgi:4'-phosphopantetheinyl transferase